MPQNNKKQKNSNEHESCDCGEDHNEIKEKVDNREIKEAVDSCGCTEDSTENEKQDTCEVGESCSTCGCEEGLLEEKEQLWNRKPLLIISASAILLVI